MNISSTRGGIPGCTERTIDQVDATEEILPQSSSVVGRYSKGQIWRLSTIEGRSRRQDRFKLENVYFDVMYGTLREVHATETKYSEGSKSKDSEPPTNASIPVIPGCGRYSKMH